MCDNENEEFSESLVEVGKSKYRPRNIRACKKQRFLSPRLYEYVTFKLVFHKIKVD